MQGGRVGPVQVLQHHDEPAARRRDEPLEDGVERERACGPGQQRARPGVGGAGDRLADRGERGPFGAPGERLQPRPQRRSTGLGVGVPTEDLDAVGGGGRRELVDEARLADPRLPPDQDDGRVPGHHGAERLAQLGQRGVPADEHARGHERSMDAERPPAQGRVGGRSRGVRQADRMVGGGDQEVRSTPWISRSIWTFSLTTTPPPSSGMAMSTPKSLRLMVVEAEKPARVPP